MSSAPPGTVWFGPITLVADNQQFHIGNEPFLFRSGFTDSKVSRSAVRVPQQDLFGNTLLGLAATDSRATLVHLGDAMDLSCIDEWDAFVHTLDASGRPSWFWAPGNHDGFFFGNFVGPLGSWSSACRPSSPMKKDQIVARYIAHLRAYSNGTLDPARSSFACATGTICGGLRAAVWNIESGDKFYRSFVLQEIEVPPPAGVRLPSGSNVKGVSLILIDTSTFERPPRIAVSEAGFRYSSGESGHLGPAQLATLERWLDATTKRDRRAILAGHHPFNDIDESDRVRLQKLMDAHQVATYISAHTHWGTYYAHAGASGYSWLEPNLGSVLDYDAEFGQLALGVNDRSDQHFVRVTRIKLQSILAAHLRGAQLGIVCDDNPAWFPRPTDADFFTNYKQTTSPSAVTLDKLYFSTMLSALDRYWRCVPTVPTTVTLTDPCIPQKATTCAARSDASDMIKRALSSGSLDEMRKTTLWLLEQDKTRAVDACKRRAYAVCQAMWAAEYEKRNYTTPSRDEDIFEVTTPPTKK